MSVSFSLLRRSNPYPKKSMTKGSASESAERHKTSMWVTSPLPALTPFRAPQKSRAKDPVEWEMFLRQSINFFFSCAAVNHVEIGQRGEKFRRWSVSLFSGNDARWFEPHKADLIRTIREARDRAGYEAAPNEIIFR